MWKFRTNSPFEGLHFNPEVCRTFHSTGKSFKELFALTDTELEAVFKVEPAIRNEEGLLELYEFFSKCVKKLARRGTAVLDHKRMGV